MNRREIFEKTMNFQEVGRVLVDQGRQVGSIHKWAYAAIRETMGLPPVKNPEILDMQSQCVWSDEDLLEAWEIDFRWILPKWTNVTWIDDITYRNTFGTIFTTANGDYYHIKESPMREEPDLTTTVENWEYWPDPNDRYLVEGLKEKAEKLYNETDYVIGLDGIKGGILQTSLELRGYDQLFVDIMLDQKGVHALFSKLTQLYCDMYTVYLNEVGQYGQVIYITDDLGAQSTLLMSPKHIRELVLPYQEKLIKHIKSLAPHLKVEYHTDGSVLPIIDDLINIGVDMLNPVQTSVDELKDTAALNKQYGDKIGFKGAMDVQNVLINSTPEEIEEEVKKRLKDLGTGGGYVISTCHNINRDIPPQNLKTMYEAISKYSSYPFSF